MPVTPTYPGVYIEEIPSGVRTIIGVATSITAFVGRARRGPVNEPVRIQSFADYERIFGGLWGPSTLSYAVSHYFLNGGADAIVVRLVNGASRATFELNSDGDEGGSLELAASNEGTWGNNLRVSVDFATVDPDGDELFNLVVEEIDPNVPDAPLRTETFRNLSAVPDSPRLVAKVLEQESALVRVTGDLPATRPAAVTDLEPQSDEGSGSDGNPLTSDDYEGSRAGKTGIFALEKADLFNLLCIPPFSPDTDVADTTWTEALTYVQERRAMLIVDPQMGWRDVEDAKRVQVDLRDKNAAIFFPRLLAADPLQENRTEEFAPCGAVAGIFARTDAQRGVWKAPAGQEANLRGIRGLSVSLTDGENGQLNPLGVNCLRSFPVAGHVVWGARTLRGADSLASEWKYIPVRRIALFIEESLYRGTQWVVFEPNDEPLWSQIRLNVGAFMQNLFRQGAFQGQSPREAYFVKCDKETTTQNDIDRGIVNILVGFAPLKPAEFVFIKISQIAGEIQT